MKYEKIPIDRRKNGYSFKLIKREGKYVLYEQLFDDKGVAGYEIHKVRLKPAMQTKYKKPDGTITIVNWPNKEILSSNGEFGTYAWSYQKKENALKKYEKLQTEERKNEIPHTIQS